MSEKSFNNNFSIENQNNSVESNQINRQQYLENIVPELANQIELNSEQLKKIKAIQIAPCGMFEGENIKGIIESHRNPFYQKKRC